MTILVMLYNSNNSSKLLIQIKLLNFKPTTSIIITSTISLLIAIFSYNFRMIFIYNYITYL